MTLALGFSIAGMLTTGYETVVRERLGLALLECGLSFMALTAAAFLVFAGPFVIMRHAIAAVMERRSGIEFVMVTTAVAAFWSLMSGVTVLMFFY